MLSFEFSVFDLVLSVSVMVLIVLFVATLLRLNPSNENKQSRDEEVFEQEQETALPPPQQPTGPISWQSTEGAVSQRTQQASRLLVSATAEGASHESLEQIPKPYENKEPHKQLKTAPSTKQVSKSSDAKDCLHHFGYLNELPKNTPIPGECFGCPKIVDCLVTKKGK